MTSKRALITGITGQDGSHLADLLLGKGYEVYGVVRRTSTGNMQRIKHLLGKITILQGDLLDQTSLERAVRLSKPNEVYNLAAQSHVHVSFEQPVLTSEITGLGALRVFEAVRQCAPEARVYQASSSEMLGDVAETPQTESTELRARSPYGAAKIFAHQMAKVYRESYGMHISCGILFNHEGERRGLEFVTRKITHHIARQALGLTVEPLRLGNLDAKRDWGYAKDYMEAAWLMLQQASPANYVIATNETRTVRKFVEYAYQALGCPVKWEGDCLDEVGKRRSRVPSAGYVHLNTPNSLVVVDPTFYRPADVDLLRGDYARAKRALGWQPRTSFRDLVVLMVHADLKLLQKGQDH